MSYSWDNITLENYAAIDALRRSTVVESNKEAYIVHWCSLLALANNKPESHYEAMDFVSLYKEIECLKTFLNTEIKERLHTVFRSAGRRFKLTCLTEEEIKGQHVEALSLLKITPETLAEKAPSILAAITEEAWTFRKKLSFNQKVELFSKQLPASIGMGVCLFFWEVLNELQPAILNSLGQKLQNLSSQSNL